MKYIMKEDDNLVIRSMGKSIKVTALFDNDPEANNYMEKHDDPACIAAFGSFVFLANKYDILLLLRLSNINEGI